MRAAWTIGAAWSLALVVSAAATLGLINLSTGASTPGIGFSQGYDAAAFRHLQGKPLTHDLKLAEELAERALSVSPYDNNARLRLAYIDAVRNGRLTASGEAQFALTYDLVPVDENVAAWRIRFGLENWTSLTARSRQALQHEVEVFDSLHGRAIDTRGILSSISDPSGRLAAALWLHSLETRSSANAALPGSLAE